MSSLNSMASNSSGRTVDLADIAQVEIAVAAPDGAGRRAMVEKLPARGEGLLAEAAQAFDTSPVKDVGDEARELVPVFVDDALDCRATAGLAVHLGELVEIGDRIGQHVDFGRRQLASPGLGIPKRLLVESLHHDQPVDRFAVAAETERAVAAANHRLDPFVKKRRRPSIDGHLIVAEPAPALGVGIIQIGKANRAFQLVGAIAGEKDDRDMRVDAPDRFADAIAFRPGQEFDDLRLGVSDHRPALLARSRPAPSHPRSRIRLTADALPIRSAQG